MRRIILNSLLIVAWSMVAYGQEHGVNISGTAVKYAKDFEHFAYADRQATVGGTLKLSSLGSFDTFNPYSLKGSPEVISASYVFESLLESSLDEPFAMYARVAESLVVADDGLSVTFSIDPLARFSDGHPIEASDVVFSYNKLVSDEATPLYKFYYKDVSAVKATDKRTVTFEFKNTNRELALILGQLPVLPEHFYSEGDFGRSFTAKMLGSGPYVLESFDMGKNVLLKRNKDYWGWNKGFSRYRYNFENIITKYYKDGVARLEAFKAGEFDFIRISSSKQWAVDAKGGKWDSGEIIKAELPHERNAGLQGFALNTQRPIFADRLVRQALALVFDFEWSNKNLFYNQYKSSHSYFSNSKYAAKGLPSSAELKLLEPLRQNLPKEVFGVPMGDPLGHEYKTIRDRLRAAKELLTKAGWQVEDGQLTNTASGAKFAFTVTLVDPSWQRIVEPYLNNLARLGIKADMRVVDSAVYEKIIRNREFDVVTTVYGQSESPGNEQIEFWHSSTADVSGSRNLSAISNPAIDALVMHIVEAKSSEELVTATQALDRALWFSYYTVPHWYLAYYRVSYYKQLQRPKTLPLYYVPQQLLEFWWTNK